MAQPLAHQALFLAQPSVSGRIQRLEDELGVPLFHRMASGVRLTDMGRTFLPPWAVFPTIRWCYCAWAGHLRITIPGLWAHSDRLMRQAREMNSPSTCFGSDFRGNST